MYKIPFMRVFRSRQNGQIFAVLFVFRLFSNQSILATQAVAEISADLVIYGGTFGGIAAAIPVKRMGKSVVLIEPSGHLGGLTTGGLGQTDIGNKAAIGGVSREFYRRASLQAFFAFKSGCNQKITLTAEPGG